MYTTLIKKLEENKNIAESKKKNPNRRYCRGLTDGIDSAIAAAKSLNKEINDDGGYLGTFHFDNETQETNLTNVSNYPYYEFDIVCATFIRHILRGYINKACFHPYFMTIEKWTATLQEVVDGFDAYINNKEVNLPQLFEKFAAIYPHLWC